MTLKRLRGRSRSALTRITNSFSNELQLCELKARLERIELIFKEFDEYDAQLPEELSEMAEFDLKYLEAKSKYRKAIDAFQNLSVWNSTSVGVSQKYISSFKLSQLNIPQFDGKYSEWMNFKDLYTAGHHPRMEKGSLILGTLHSQTARMLMGHFRVQNS